ncbi:MAG: hypothetical protein ACRBB6_08610 [Neptuniibacter sp.]
MEENNSAVFKVYSFHSVALTDAFSEKEKHACRYNLVTSSMTIELRKRMNALKKEITQREDAARVTAHRIAIAQADFEDSRRLNRKQDIFQKKQSTSEVKIVELAETQMGLIEEALLIAKSAEERAFKAEIKTLAAERHALFAIIISVFSLTFMAAQYLVVNGV